MIHFTAIVPSYRSSTKTGGGLSMQGRPVFDHYLNPKYEKQNNCVYTHTTTRYVRVRHLRVFDCTIHSDPGSQRSHAGAAEDSS